MTNALRLAEAFQGIVDRMWQEGFSVCEEAQCGHPAAADGVPFVAGHDDRGAEVWMQKIRCAAGHFYHRETEPLTQDPS